MGAQRLYYNPLNHAFEFSRDYSEVSLQTTSGTTVRLNINHFLHIFIMPGTGYTHLTKIITLLQRQIPIFDGASTGMVLRFLHLRGTRPYRANHPTRTNSISFRLQDRRWRM